MANYDLPRAAWNTPQPMNSNTMEHDLDPPAYSERMSRNVTAASQSSARHTACCAFQKLDANTHPSNSQSQLQKSPQLRLVSWVLLCRIADASIPIGERFSCPMANCDMVFGGNDHMDLVRHVSDCPHMSEGMYRCPYHESPRIERFMEAAHSNRARKFFKGRFFRHTIGKICDLGSRGRRARSQVGQRDVGQPQGDEKARMSTSSKRPFSDDGAINPSFPRLVSSSMPYFAPEPFPDPLPVPISDPVVAYQTPIVANEAAVEIDNTPRGDLFSNDALFFPDLVSTSVPVEDAEFSEFGLPELPTGALYNFPELEAPSHQQMPEFPSNRMSSSSTQSLALDAFTPESAMTPVSPLTPRSVYSTEGFDLPISPADVFLYGNADYQIPEHPSITAKMEMNPPNLIPRPTISPRVDQTTGGLRKPLRQIPDIRVDTACNTPPAVEDVSPFSSIPSESPVSDASELAPPGIGNFHDIGREDGDAPAKQLVQELRGLFNRLFQLSMRKLCQPSVTAAGAHLLSLQPSAAQLFTAGVAALRKVVKNEMPQDFFEVLGLSILPYACGIASMNENMQDQFGLIFQEQLGWGQAIVDPALRKTYFELVWELWSTSEFLMPGGYNVSRQFSEQSIDGLCSPQGGQEDFFSMSDFNLGNAQHSATGVSAADLGFRTSLFSVHNTAINLCLGYLDAFEYLQVNIQKMTTSGQDAPGFGYVPSGPEYSSIIIQQVMQPLRSNLSFGTFKPVVDMARFVIDGTQNITLRSTELSLLAEGKVDTHAYSRHTQSSSMQGQRNAPLLVQGFVGEVHRLCDNAAGLMGCPGYRSFYHMNDIDKIMEFHHELLAIEQYERMHRSRSPSLGSRNGKSPVNISPASSGRCESFTSTPHRAYAFTFSSASSSPIDAGIYHSRNNSNENVFGSGRTSAFPASQSPTTQPSAWERPRANKRVSVRGGGETSRAGPRPDEKVKKQCQHCGQCFESQAQYIKANVTRHIREKHSDNAKKLVCGEPGCSYTSTRKGNLTHHQRAVHGAT